MDLIQIEYASCSEVTKSGLLCGTFDQRTGHAWLPYSPTAFTTFKSKIQKSLIYCPLRGNLIAAGIKNIQYVVTHKSQHTVTPHRVT